MNYFLLALKKYAVFTGRSRRSEYWYFVLFNFILSIVIQFIDNALGTVYRYEDVTTYSSIHIEWGYIGLVFSLLMLIPSLAVAVRRLHDVGKSGTFFFIIFIPLVGIIWLIVLFCTDSQEGENKWGPNPKGIGNHDDIDSIGSDMQRR